MIAEKAADPLLRTLRDHGLRFRRVRYRENRSVLFSVSRDRRTLNSHECFRRAPGAVHRAIARYLVSPRGSRAAREALAAIQGWEGTRMGLQRARKRRPPRRPAGRGEPVPASVSGLYDRFNDRRFGGRLPEIPLRISRRMTRTLGTISYGGRGPGRSVREIALSADLLLPGNEAVLRDTLLHEMAHAEAWLEHGHRGHGPVWRAVAERVGCTPRALIGSRVRRSRRAGRGGGRGR